MSTTSQPTQPGRLERRITALVAVALAGLVVWWVVEYNMLLIVWVAGGLALALVAVLTAAMWRKGIRWFFSGRALRFHLWVLAGLISVLVLFYAEENWRGQRNWAGLQRELAARGESVGLDSVIPAPVPDELNFAAAPGVAEALGFNQRGTNQLTFFHGDPHEWPHTTWAHGQFTDFATWYRVIRAELNRGRPVQDQPTGAPGSLEDSAREVIKTLEHFDPALEALGQASARPRCRYPLNYQEAWLSISRGIFDNLHNVGSVLSLRACAELRMGDSSAALQDVLLLLRLADTLSDEPFLSAHRLRLELLMLAVQPVWEGVAARRWAPVELNVLQQRFTTMQPWREFQRLPRTETVLLMHLASQFEAYARGQDSALASLFQHTDPEDAFFLWLFKTFYPEGWLAQDRVWLYRFYERHGAGQAGPPLRRPLSNEQWRREWRRAMDPNLLIFVVPRLHQAFDDSAEWSLYSQAIIRQVRAGCALERFRAEQGGFPEELSMLVPQYLAEVPADSCADRKQPMRYQLLPGGYRLYSIGLNGVDDGGAVADNQEHWRTGHSLVPRLSAGDWRWEVGSGKPEVGSPKSELRTQK